MKKRKWARDPIWLRPTKIHFFNFLQPLSTWQRFTFTIFARSRSHLHSCSIFLRSFIYYPISSCSSFFFLFCSVWIWMCVRWAGMSNGSDRLSFAFEVQCFSSFSRLKMRGFFVVVVVSIELLMLFSIESHSLIFKHTASNKTQPSKKVPYHFVLFQCFTFSLSCSRCRIVHNRAVFHMFVIHLLWRPYCHQCFGSFSLHSKNGSLFAVYFKTKQYAYLHLYIFGRRCWCFRGF